MSFQKIHALTSITKYVTNKQLSLHNTNILKQSLMYFKQKALFALTFKVNQYKHIYFSIRNGDSSM